MEGESPRPPAPVCWVCRQPAAVLIRALRDGNVNDTICPGCLGKIETEALIDENERARDLIHSSGPKGKPKAKRPPRLVGSGSAKRRAARRMKVEA